MLESWIEKVCLTGGCTPTSLTPIRDMQRIKAQSVQSVRGWR